LRHARVGLIVFAFATMSVAAGQAAASGGADASAGPPVRIGGPHKLKAAKVLEFPIFVSADSLVKVQGALRLPGPNIGVNVSGTILQGHPREVKLTLNGPAKNNLKTNYKVSSLKIIVTARNLLTNIKHTARKTFRFKR
jgi:hypothetical protein